MFYEEPVVNSGIHPSAVVAPTAKIGQNVSLGANVVVGENTVMAALTGIAGSTKIGKQNCTMLRTTAKPCGAYLVPPFSAPLLV